MGNNKEDLVVECEACKQEIVPIKIARKENLYSCPNCNTVLTIEKTVEFESDLDLNRTLH